VGNRNVKVPTLTKTYVIFVITVEIEMEINTAEDGESCSLNWTFKDFTGCLTSSVVKETNKNREYVQNFGNVSLKIVF
jgi:hypothetical protein